MIRDDPSDNLAILNTLMMQRKQFRGDMQHINQDTSPSESMIEELMLLSHTFLAHFVNKVMRDTKMKLEDHKKEEEEKKRQKKEEQKKKQEEQRLKKQAAKAKKAEEKAKKAAEKAEKKRAKAEKKRAKAEANS